MASEFDLTRLPQALTSTQARIAIVLGSGLGALVDSIEITASVPYTDVVGLPPSQVASHAGRFVTGSIAGRDVLIAQGRTHLYEGHSAQAVTAGVRLMAALGVQTLILTNAAGTANPEFQPGSWMQLSDHLNLTGQSPLTGGPHFVDMSDVYSARLRTLFGEAARESHSPLHSGVYAAVAGPQYETPAEVRMLRRLGADAIGMSTVPEAIQARALGMEVAGFSCLTNWGAGLGDQPLDHSEVTESGKQAGAIFSALLRTVIARI